jgi:ATP-binding protein involved in chromosome partitioning
LRSDFNAATGHSTEEVAMITEKDVLHSLAAIAGPDGKTPLPQSGAIAGLTTVGGKVYLSIEIDPAQSMALEPMRLKAEQAIKAMSGVSGASVTLTSARAQGQASNAAPAGAKPQPGVPKQAEIPGVKRIIAVASGKGGVGKSTTSANFALALAAQGWKVGILDADIYGPSMPRLFGLRGKPQSDGRKLFPMEAFGLKIMSIGFLVDEDTAMIWRGPMVQSALTQMMRDVVWGELDCLVVDMPPGTGDAQLTMAQAVPLSGAVIVSTPQDLALIDARRAVAMFNKVNIPILGVLENMSYFLCPHCGGRSDVFAHGGARHEAERLGVSFLGEVPLHMAIRENSDAGRPVVAIDPKGSHAAIYRGIADGVRASLEQGNVTRAFPKIVVE